MLGSLNPQEKRVSVIGGGASGLFAAYALTKAGYTVEVFEASGRVGGMLQTVHSLSAHIECSAHSLVLTTHLQRLCEDIGIRLDPLDKAAQAKFILRNNKMRRMPLRKRELISLLARAGFARRRASDRDVRSFALHHLGKAAADYLFEPMVTGIYGARADQLDMALCFPSLLPSEGQSLLSAAFFKKKSTAPSVGKRVVVAPREGMAQFMEKLAYYLQKNGCNIHLNNSVSDLPKTGNVILAVPARQAAELLKNQKFLWSGALRTIPYTPMMSVAVQISKTCFSKIPQGLGVLIPPAEGLHTLGVLFSSSSFPTRLVDDAKVLLTVMLGGQRHSQDLDRDDASIRSLVEKELSIIFGNAIHLDSCLIHRWPKAIPLYTTQHAELLSEIEHDLQARPGLILTGSYAGEVSLRGMLDASFSLLAK